MHMVADPALTKRAGPAAGRQRQQRGILDPELTDEPAVTCAVCTVSKQDFANQHLPNSGVPAWACSEVRNRTRPSSVPRRGARKHQRVAAQWSAYSASTRAGEQLLVEGLLDCRDSRARRNFQRRSDCPIRDRGVARQQSQRHCAIMSVRLFQAADRSEAAMNSGNV
jgi:hypothetical protein